MEKKIQVQVKSVYGTDKAYPICEQAKIFAEMVGQTTLTRSNLHYIKKLGYTVEAIIPTSTIL